MPPQQSAKRLASVAFLPAMDRNSNTDPSRLVSARASTPILGPVSKASQTA